MEKKVGLTKDAGWQFGIRKSIALNMDEVWDFLFSENGTQIWLKNADADFSTFRQLSHIRTKWKLKDWSNEATLQMRVLPNKGKTTIAFHIDKLQNEHQREEVKVYWEKTLDDIIRKLSKKEQ